MKNGIKSLLITSFVITVLLLATPASATPTTTVSIADVTIEPGSNITLPINIVNIVDYGTGTIKIEYDPAVVHVTDVTGSSDSKISAENINNTIGLAMISAWNLSGVSGDIVFANVIFEAVASTGNSTPLNLTVDTLMNITSFVENIPNIEISNGTVTISTSPILTITLPEEGQVVNSSRIEWQSTGDLTDANHTILKLDSNANISYLPLSGNYTFQTDDGYHNVQAWLAYADNTPLANPESYAILNFTLDTATTVTINTVTTPTNVNSQTVTGTMESGATVEVTCPNATVGTVNYPTDTTWSVEITGMSEGDNVITASSTDQAGNTASATVSITVSVVNNPPVAEDQSVTTPKDTSVEIILKATDADSDLLTYIIVDNPSNGTVTLSGNTATYTPDANYNSPDSFTFKANDGTDNSNIATVLISVNDIKTAPTITNASATPSGIFLKKGKGKPRSDKFVARLNATVLDAGGIANVTVDLSTIGGLSVQPMTQIAGTDVWTVTTYATSGISQTHELVVTATDVSGNTNTSSIYLTVLLRGRRSYV